MKMQNKIMNMREKFVEQRSKSSKCQKNAKI